MKLPTAYRGAVSSEFCRDRECAGCGGDDLNLFMARVVAPANGDHAVSGQSFHISVYSGPVATQGSGKIGDRLRRLACSLDEANALRGDAGQQIGGVFEGDTAFGLDALTACQPGGADGFAGLHFLEALDSDEDFHAFSFRASGSRINRSKIDL